MSDIEKTAMEKLASDPKAQAAAQVIEKVAYNMYMRGVQATLTKAAEADLEPETDMTEEEAIWNVAKAIKENPGSVPEEVVAEFVDAVMGDPELEAAVEQEVKAGMRRDIYKKAYYDQAALNGQPTRREMYKNALYKQAHEASIRKYAEDEAIAITPEGEAVDPELIEAIIEIVKEQSGEGEEGPIEEEEITAEDVAPEKVLQALEAMGDPIPAGATPEVINDKVAGLIEANKNAGRIKVATALINTYFPE